MHPVAIGGVGGSGTRLVAELLAKLGIDFGDDLNGSRDTLWFTLLFKRLEILRVDEREFDLLVRALVAGLRGGDPLPPAMARLLAGLAQSDRPQHPSPWLQARVATLLDAAARPEHHGRWGWKEPNTHVVIERLWQRLPDLRYVHVVRHGLDMAYSSNQNQLQLWGRDALGEDGPSTPSRALAYWCHVHRRIQELHLGNRQRMYLLDYGAFCARPEQQAVPLLQFLGLPAHDLPGLADMIVSPRPRVPWEPLETFAPSDLAYLRSLGYDIARGGAPG